MLLTLARNHAASALGWLAPDAADCGDSANRSIVTEPGEPDTGPDKATRVAAQRALPGMVLESGPRRPQGSRSVGWVVGDAARAADFPSRFRSRLRVRASNSSIRPVIRSERSM